MLGLLLRPRMSADRRRSHFSSLAAALVLVGGMVWANRARKPVQRPGAVTQLTPAQEPLKTQQARGAEHGRGRRATSPWRIPWAGWKDILWRTYQEIQNDRLLAVAAGVVFYSLLALFPAVTAGVSIYAIFADAGTIARHISELSAVMPGGAIDIVSEQVGRIVQRGTDELSLGFAIGVGVALWSANAGMKAIFDALNVIYDEDEKRSFIKLNLISMSVTLAAIGFVLVMLASIALVPFLLGYIGLQSSAALILSYGRWPALFVISVLALSVLYRIGPSRERPRWQWLSVGSVFAAAMWMLMSIAFSWYVANFGTYNATYGSLGAAIGMMMWMWLSIIVVLVGAELNSEIEHQTARDSTTGAPQPLGLRGATMADTVGEAQR